MLKVHDSGDHPVYLSPDYVVSVREEQLPSGETVTQIESRNGVIYFSDLSAADVARRIAQLRREG